MEGKTILEEQEFFFDDLGLSDKSLLAIKEKGFVNATPIQAQIIPLFLESKQDLIGQANTGTGKTAAFGLPLLDLVDKKLKQTQAIILVPTRELAIQVFKEIQSFNKHGVSMSLFYGGQNMRAEKRELKLNPQIVVGTPGRLKDHVNKRLLHLENIKYFVLDEADEMLNIGFREDIEFMLSKTPTDKRVLLFSATMPKAILDIAQNYMREYKKISVKAKFGTNKNIEQKRFEVNNRQKFDALCRIIEMEPGFYGIVFCRTKADVDEVASSLNAGGFPAEAIHGDVDQKNREKVLNRFKQGKMKILVATDVAARGIDVEDLTHVINFSLPENPEIYTHRVGRTGRAGKTGVAISLVPRGDVRKLFFIERIIKKKIDKGQLPTGSELIKLKKQRFFNEINEITKKGNLEKFDDIVEELLNLGEPKQIISAILKHRYQNDFDPKKIPDFISSNSRDSRFRGGEGDKDEIRIFVAKGRNAGFGPRELIDLIKNEVDIDSNKIQEIRILDDFSFATLPYAEGDILIHVYKKKAKGNKPLIVKAKPSGGGRSGGGLRFGGGSRGGRRNYGAHSRIGNGNIGGYRRR